MKFVCLGYIEEQKVAEVLQEEGQRMMEACFAYDDELRRGGHFVGGEALDSCRKAVTLRVIDGKSGRSMARMPRRKKCLAAFCCSKPATCSMRSS